MEILISIRYFILLNIFKAGNSTMNTGKHKLKRLEYSVVEQNLDNTVHEYGMGVQDAWTQGYTGKGVVVAVTDVGVDIYHLDLNNNINHTLSKSFVSDGLDVQPKQYPQYPESLAITDHGTRCSGLIAAKRNASSCTSGIAYNAKIAVLKIFNTSMNRGGMVSYLSDAVLKGLSYKIHDIDIYSNSWIINKPFKSLTLSSKATISFGIRKGRNGRGSIHVFPVGNIADGFAQSKYTITVGSIGVNGSDTYMSEPCACVLTSALGQGVNINSTFIKTTSHSEEKCTNDFQGTSASVSMVSAMIALALHSNNHLTWRDVQHILVRSSSHEGLQETPTFKSNGAGFNYHIKFGFGLVNAQQMVMLAKYWLPVREPVSQTYISNDDNLIEHHEHNQIASASLQVNCKEEGTYSCIHHLEHVEVKLSYMTSNENNLKITLTSPAGTISVLMDKGQSMTQGSLREHLTFLSVNFWGENSRGKWILKLYQHGHKNYEGKPMRLGILSFSLTISGTCKDVLEESIVVEESENKKDVHVTSTYVNTDSKTPALPAEHNGKYTDFEITYIYVNTCFSVVFVFLEARRSIALL